MDLLWIFIRPRPTRLTCLIAGEVQAGVPRACMVLPLVGRRRGRGQPLQVGLRAAGDHPARQVGSRERGVELQTNHWRSFHNHGEGPYYGLLQVESAY